MEILKITAADLDENGFYIGKADVPNFAGHVEIAADLGWVRFKAALRAAGYIRALAGSGIEAGLGISAGEDIEAGWGINAGSYINAGEGIKAGCGIKAGSYINAGSGISAGEDIEAGWDINAGLGIKAGLGISAGLSISATFVSTPTRIFAGLCLWRFPTAEETQIRAEIRSGTVAFGEVVPPQPHSA